MKQTQNTKHVSWFDTAAITFVAIGIFMVATLVFYMLTPKVQRNIAMSFNILDIGEPAQTQLENTLFTFEISNNFLDQFYLSFIQVTEEAMQIPSDVRIAYESFGNYADGIAYDYNRDNTKILPNEFFDSFGSEIASDATGIVSGASVEVSEPIVLIMPYSYQAIDINLLINHVLVERVKLKKNYEN